MLAGLIAIAYVNALTSAFHFDDSAIFKVAGIVSPGFGWDLFGPDQTRPLTWLTFHANYLIGGKEPLLYHVFNVLLHMGNVALLLAIARRYVSPVAAFGVAAVFALHPIQTESVTYVYARSTLLSTHFALWTLWFFGLRRYVTSAVLFAVSLLAKEEAVALPAFLLLLDLYERRRPNLRYYGALLGMVALTAAHLAYLIISAPAAIGVGRVRGISTLEYLLSQGRVLWIYLRILIAPYDLNLDRDVAVSTSLFSPAGTLPALVALAALCAVLGRLAWSKRSQAALWALGFFILIAPSSSIVAQADLIFEHRTYLPLLCLAIGLGFLLERLKPAQVATGIAILIPVLLGATVVRNAAWHDEKSFAADLVAKSPNKGRAWLALAEAWSENPALQGRYLERGLAVDPANPELHNNYGILLLGRNQAAEAMEHFRRAREITGDTADAWNNIGGAYFVLREPDQALQSFRKALALDPCSFNARRNVIKMYADRGDVQAAYRAGLPPDNCRLLPNQARELADLRVRLAAP